MQFSLTYMINRKVHSEARSERDCSRALLEQNRDTSIRVLDTFSP